MTAYTHPLKLDHAAAWRVYLGGKNIRALRGDTAPVDNHFPEEWIASTTAATGAGAVPDAGLSHLAEDAALSLRALIASDPKQYLGDPFVQKHGGDCGVLLKLLDAAERLNIQVHPSRSDARRLWNTEYGKTECWHFLPGDSNGGVSPVIHLGLKRHITKQILKDAFESGDPQQVLDCMYTFPVHPGETVLVESGIPHAIGAGCFLLEIQEPTDMTLRFERMTASGTRLDDSACHLGIGYDEMFSLIRYDGLSRQETRERWFIPPVTVSESASGRITQLIGWNRCPYFSMDCVDVRTRLLLPQESAFRGLFCLSGTGKLRCQANTFALHPDDQFFIPAGCPDLEILANEPLSVIHFRGPAI